jgi:hypothetical protein
MKLRLGKREVYIALAVVVALVALLYPHYFNWWDHRNCTESGGTWNEAQDKCVEPRGADIPDTKPSVYDDGGAKPRE